jgi:hypothetical protein
MFTLDLSQKDNDSAFLHLVIFSDEATFHVSDKVNTAVEFGQIINHTLLGNMNMMTLPE